MNHLCWWTAVSVVLCSISVEAIQIRVHVLACISTLGYVWMLWKVDLQSLSKKHGTLFHIWKNINAALWDKVIWHSRRGIYIQQTIITKQWILRNLHRPNLQKMYCQFSLETIPHLNKCMIRLVAKKLNPHYVSIERKQVEQLILIYSLGTETFLLHEYQESIKNYIQKQETRKTSE